jgi:hypothetical protein
MPASSRFDMFEFIQLESVGVITMAGKVEMSIVFYNFLNSLNSS